MKKCSNITNAGLTNFCPDAGRFLTNLDLTDCSQITDKGMFCLAEHCTKLSTLNLFGVPNVTDDGLSRVAAKCIRLAYLDFSADINSLDTTKKARVPHIGGEGLAQMGKYSAFMKSLRCSGAARVDDLGLIALSAGCPELETVALRYCYQITSLAVIALAENCPNLTYLDVGSCVGVTDDAVAALAKNCFKLKHIDLLGLRKVTDKSMVPFARSHPNLESVNLQGCDMLTDDSVVAIAETAGMNLLHLDVNGVDEVGDRSLKALKKHCLNMRSADFTFSTVSDAGVLSMVTALPYSRKLGGRPALKPVNKSVVAFNQYTQYHRRLEVAQTRLAVYIRVFLTKRYFQKIRAHKIHCLTQIQKMIRSKLARMVVLRIRARNQLEWDSTIPIQRFYRAYREQVSPPTRPHTHTSGPELKWLCELPCEHTLGSRLPAACSKRPFTHTWNYGALATCFYVRAVQLFVHSPSLLLTSPPSQLFAVALVADRRRKYFMAKRIQGQWRVCMAKNAVKLVKFRMFKIGKKFQRLIKKILDRESYLQRLLATGKLLKWWRQMIENLKKYRSRTAASKIQNCWRCMLARVNKDDKLAGRLQMWNKASKKIQLGLRVMVVWKKQIRRVRASESEFKQTFALRVKSAKMIQNEYRGYKDKGAARAMIAYQRLRKKSVTMIQGAWRSFLARTAVRRAKKYKAFLTGCWGRFTSKYMFRYKTKYASRIVKMVRDKLWWEHRKSSVVVAQRVLRGHIGRTVFRDEWYAVHSLNASILIQYIVRKFLKRLAIEEEEWRNDCAAMIQRKWKRHKEWKAYKQLMHKIYEEKAGAAIREKEALERQRQQNLLQRIFEKGESKAARNIQTCYRKYIHKKHQDEAARIANERTLRDQKEEEERRLRMVDRKKHKGSVLGKLHDGLEYVGSHLNWMTSKKDPHGKVLDERDAEIKAMKALKPSRTGFTRALLGPDKEETKTSNEVWDNSILNKQTRSIESEGILGMKITIGGGELFAFSEEQKANKLARRKDIWKRIDVDLSGRKKDKVYIWLLRGIGKEVYTSITLAQPPDNYNDMRVQKSRHAAMEMIGTFVIWHLYLATLEVHCHAAVMAGESAPPIDAIEITQDEDEWEKMKAREFEQVLPDLQKQGGLGRNVSALRATERSEAIHANLQQPF